VSRIGKKPIVIPDKVQVTIENGYLKAKGPKGAQEMKLSGEITYTMEDKLLTFSRNSDVKQIRAMHGLTRALAFNLIEGVTNGFAKTLQIEGVGYKAELRGTRLMLSLGYSHPILIVPPEGVQIETTNPTTIIVKGIDKQLVGEVSARIRRLRPPEPYKGKGIHYLGEYVRRKAGKTASK
jgi:large subunit ribosomal protein L6